MLAAGRCGRAVSLPQGPASRPCLRCTARTVAAGTHHTFHENIVSDGGTTAGYTNAPLFAITPVVNAGCSQGSTNNRDTPRAQHAPAAPMAAGQESAGRSVLTGPQLRALLCAAGCARFLGTQQLTASPKHGGRAPWPRPPSEGSWTRVDTGSHTPREQGQSGGISDCGQRPEGPVKGPRAQLPQPGAALAPRLHAQMQTGIRRRP